jgi:hypothetical protein
MTKGVRVGKQPNCILFLKGVLISSSFVYHFSPPNNKKTKKKQRNKENMAMKPQNPNKKQKCVVAFTRAQIDRQIINSE